MLKSGNILSKQSRIRRVLISMPLDYCIIDTETTGMRASSSRIVDIGIIRVKNGVITNTFESLINPGITIPSKITEITSISESDLINAPSFDEVALEIAEILRGAVFVAHNVQFDYSFVQSEFRRIGMDFQALTLCTVRMSRALFPDVHGHSLDAIIYRHNLSVRERHRAMPDAYSVFDFISSISKYVPIKKLQSAMNTVFETQGVHISSSTIKSLTDTTGVYIFSDSKHNPLYIGKSKHIRTRVQSHFRTNSPRSLSIQGETMSIDTIQTNGELSALILEASLIKSSEPVYNRALRKKSALLTVQRKSTRSGYDTLAFTYMTTLQADPTILAIYKTKTQAKVSLRNLATENNICHKRAGLENGPGECFAHQLGTCDGACIGKISAHEYHERIKAAFAKRKIQVWPYNGVIMINESQDGAVGTIFFIDNWCVTGAFKYDETGYSPFLKSSNIFDYDIYKIILRYLRNKQHAHTIRTLTPKEYKEQHTICNNITEDSEYVSI